LPNESAYDARVRRTAFYICVALLAYIIGMTLAVRFGYRPFGWLTGAPICRERPDNHCVQPGERIVIIDRDHKVTVIQGK
jgi:hypothetical protein